MEPVSNPAYKHATRIRESVDETFSRYLLELEGRKAQAKLQEQALAAFPNSDIHEPVAHFMNGESEDEDEEMDDRPATWEGHDEDEYIMNVRTPHGRGSTHEHTRFAKCINILRRWSKSARLLAQRGESHLSSPHHGGILEARISLALTLLIARHEQCVTEHVRRCLVPI